MKKILFGLAFIFSTLVHAQTNLLQIVVPNPPGGVVDLYGRAMAKVINETNSNVNAIVVNKPGADGKIGVRYFLENSAKQDMILVAATGPILFNKVFSKRLDYDFKDFDFVLPLGTTPIALAASKSSGITSVNELIKYSEKKSLNCAGGSSAIVFAGKMFLQQLKVTNVEFIPFKGTGDLIPAFMSGAIDCMFDPIPTIPQNDKTVLLAVSSSTKWPDNPSLPLFADSVPNFNFFNFYGFAVNSKLEKGDKERLLTIVNKASKTQQWLTGQPKGIQVSQPVKDSHGWLEQRYSAYEKVRKSLNIEQVD